MYEYISEYKILEPNKTKISMVKVDNSKHYLVTEIKHTI